MKKAILLSLPLILICLAQALAGNSTIIAGTAPLGVEPYWGAKALPTPAIDPSLIPTGPSEPNPRTILQGGDNFGDAFIVPSLPFEDNGTTSGYNDDYTDPCGGTSMGPDVVYSYTPTVDQVVNIHLCGTTFYSVLYVYENSVDNLLACSSFSLVCGYDIPRGSLDLLQLTAGNTYYIVIDGYYTSQGPYSIQISEPPHVECPPTAIAENEPACGDEYVDTYNSGCNDTLLQVYTPIAIGDTICGSTGTFAFQGGRARDTDWYTVTTTETQVLTWSAVAECPIQIMMFYAADCSNLIDLNYAQGNAGDSISISANCVPGTYYLFISPQNFDPVFTCPITYLAWLNTSPSQPAPANDECLFVDPVQLTSDAPVTFTGDNTWATMDCINLGMPESWIAFSIDFPANITLDYCGTTPAFGTCFVVLENSCPCGDYIGFNMYTQFTCSDHNFTIRWDSLAPGTYYYPIMSKWGIASGQYNINVVANAYPEMEVEPAPITGEVEAGNSTTVPMTITNTGNAQLNYHIETIQNAGRLLSHQNTNGSEPFFGTQKPVDFISNLNPQNGSSEEVITVDCPQGSVQEMEVCGEDMNGGCNSEPTIFEPIALNGNVCGTIWSDPSSRDLDWYEFTITEPIYLTFTGTAEFPFQAGLFNGTSGCPGTFVTAALAETETPAIFSTTLYPGTYWLVVTTQDWFNMPCDGSGQFTNNYVINTHTDPAWLQVSATDGSIPAGGDPSVITVTLDGTNLSSGTYQGMISVTSNAAVNTRVDIPVTLNVTGGGGCSYVIGDVNSSGGFNGVDVVFAVSYFKGGVAPAYSCECGTHGIWFVAGDVNASCNFNGVDVTYMVSYFKGGPAPHPCADCPPVRNLKGNGNILPLVAPSNNSGTTNAE